jgi:hypothetical protein
MSGDWSLEFSDDHGIAGSVHLVVPAGSGRASYTAHISLPGEGVVVVEDDDVAPPKGPLLAVRADGLWAELVCETPGEHWSFGLEAFGLRFDDADEASVSDRGDRVAIGLDLEWEAPHHVRGEILLATRRIPFDGRGAFTC